MEWARTDLHFGSRLMILKLGRRELVELGLWECITAGDPVTIAARVEDAVAACRPNLAGLSVEAMRQNPYGYAMEFVCHHQSFQRVLAGGCLETFTLESSADSPTIIEGAE